MSPIVTLTSPAYLDAGTRFRAQRDIFDKLPASTRRTTVSILCCSNNLAMRILLPDFFLAADLRNFIFVVKDSNRVHIPQSRNPSDQSLLGLFAGRGLERSRIDVWVYAGGARFNWLECLCSTVQGNHRRNASAFCAKCASRALGIYLDSPSDLFWPLSCGIYAWPMLEIILPRQHRGNYRSVTLLNAMDPLPAGVPAPTR